MALWSAWLSALGHVNDVDGYEKLICADIVEAFFRAGGSAIRDGYMIMGRDYLGPDAFATLHQRGEEALNFLQTSKVKHEDKKRDSAGSHLIEQFLGDASSKRRRTRHWNIQSQ